MIGVREGGLRGVELGRSLAGRRGWSGGLVILVGAVSIGFSTRLDDPPRYDGAGYAMLGRALAEGRGYREIGDPESRRHSHFPPGFPAALGLLWWAEGRTSVATAHLFSVGCTLVAIGATWRWWLGTEPRSVALLMGLALAVNWGWGRVGGSIQSEPLFLAFSAVALLLARSRGAGRLILGVVLGAAVLTRHVGICLAAAVGLDQWLGARRSGSRKGSVVWLILGAMILPWVVWQIRVGSGTQASLFRIKDVPRVLVGQIVFYVQRIPDAMTGPFVEAATVFGRSRIMSGLAMVWAIVATSIVVVGWVRMLGSARQRMGALIPMASLGLLLVWPFTEAGRFLIPLVPFLLMGAVEGLAPILRAVRLRRSRTWAAGLVLAASLPYSVYAVATDRAGAQRRTHQEFEAACRWIAEQQDHPGPVLARHPGDVFWLTGRPSVAIPEFSGDPVERVIDRFKVAYLLDDSARYVHAPDNPLSAYLASHPRGVRWVWKGRGGVSVYEVGRLEGGGP